MIIKCTRIPARGSALKRVIAHVENADDNEAVVALRGTFADLWDARDDARRFGRQYAARHWIISPSHDSTDDEMMKAVDLLAIEFGFDSKRAVVRGHTKTKAIESLFDRHIHVLVAETDPVTGRVLSTAHDFLRNEKVSRIWEAGREPFVRGAHTKAVIAALAVTSHYAQIAEALRAAFPEDAPKPAQSFDTANAQRLKRAGFDLPTLRVIVAAAWEAASTRELFQSRLSDHALTVRAGDKPGVYMIETADGQQVGSLARLAKLKKAELLKKMEKPNAGTSEETYNRGSDLPQHADAAEAVGAHQSAGGIGAGVASDEPTWDDAGPDEPVAAIRPADDREAGPDHRVAVRAIDREGRNRHAERLRAGHDFQFALGLAPYSERLQLMLGTANRMALPSAQRVILELGEIGDHARVARSMIDAPPSEPSTLVAARTAATETGQHVLTVDDKFDQASAAVVQLEQRLPWWRRAIGFFTGDNARRAAELRAAVAMRSKAQAKLAAAKAARSSADIQLTRETQLHKDSVRDHVTMWTREAKAAEFKAAGAARSQELLRQLPGAVTLGAAGLCMIAANLAAERDRQLSADGQPRISAQP